jgi:hypothetical protein
VSPHQVPRSATPLGKAVQMRRVLSLIGVVQAVLLACLTVGVAAASATPPPQTVYVAGAGGIDSAGASDSNDCTSASLPCATLAQALQDVAADGTVYVSGSLGVATAVTVGSDVTIAAAPSASAAVLSGTVADATGLLSVGTATVTIQGITFEGGRSIAGGAISVAGGDLTVTGSTFTDDAAIGIGAGGYGGAIDNDGGTVTVASSTFADDTSTSDRYDGHGGAIFNAAGALSVSGSTFTDDSATTDSGEGNGGAIDNGDGDDPAGAANSSLIVTDSTFNGNSATSAGGNGDGGAVDSGDDTTASGISVSISGSTFENNTAGAIGGAIANGTAGASTLSVTGSTFEDNSAHGALSDGGAIDNADECGAGDVLVVSSTFVSNSASSDGGAIDNADCGVGTLTIVESTFTGNVVNGTNPPLDGGTIDNSDYGGSGTASLAGDVIDGACDQAPGGTWTDDGYNAATDDSCLGSPVAATDAPSSAAAGGFGTLAANGGPTPTLPLAAGNPGLGLIAVGASVAVSDAAGVFPTVTVSCPTNADQRGAGFGSAASSACDAGAVQLEAQSVSFTSSPPAGTAVGAAAYTPTGDSSAGLPVSFFVDPATTNAACALINGTIVFDHAGLCTIDASAGDTNFAATQDQQSITVGAANTSTSLLIGTTQLTASVAALAPGGGTPTGTVTFSAGGQPVGTADLVDGSAAVTYSVPQNTTQTIVASYQGTADYAGSVVSVDESGPSVGVTFTSTPPGAAVVGGPGYTPAAASTGGLPVSYAIDPATTASACTLAGGEVSFVHAGTCVIDAQALSGGSVLSAQQTFTVSAARTVTALTVAPAGLTAVVDALAPASGTPTGTVTFTVAGQTIGTASLVGGRAGLGYTIAAGAAETITAAYGGSDDYTASSASDTADGAVAVATPRSVAKPTITASLSSSKRRSASGWWRTPVKVSFRCTTHGTTLQGGCPSSVTLRRSRKDQTVTRRIRTTNGGSAVVTVRGIRIDLTRPRVRITGVHNHARYHGIVPPANCAASDRFSGIASCRLSSRVTRSSDQETITYRATAVNHAGVAASATATVSSTP